MKTKTKAKRERFKLSQFINPSGETAWRVKGTGKDGIRVRKNFKSEGEAIGHKQTLEAADLNFTPLPLMATNLTRPQLDDASLALSELKSGTLVMAVRYFNENFRDPLKPTKLTDAVEKFKLERKGENLRHETLNNLRFRLGAFVDRVPDGKLVSDILPDQIKDFLHRKDGKARGFRTIKNDRLVLSKFFNWCKTNKVVVDNPMEAVPTIKVDRKRPEVFDLATVRGLLSAALAYEDGKTVPYFAIGFFGGLRPTEAERLSWDAIDLADKLITVQPDTTKVRGNERFVAISANLMEWLTPHALKRTTISIDRKDFEAVKALAGIKKWPQDVLRHTAISNYQAEHKHEGLTAEWAGNSVEVIKVHYRRAIKPVLAKEYWGITPATVGAEIIDIKQAVA